MTVGCLINIHCSLKITSEGTSIIIHENNFKKGCIYTARYYTCKLNTHWEMTTSFIKVLVTEVRRSVNDIHSTYLRDCEQD